MKRYYINNFTDGYNQDCIDICQKKLTAVSQINKRSALTPLKMSFLVLIGVMIATYIFLPKLFPYPDQRLADIAPKEYDDSKFKVLLLHHLIYSGVFLLGSSMIYSKSIHTLTNVTLFLDNGKYFCDDCTRIL